MKKSILSAFALIQLSLFATNGSWVPNGSGTGNWNDGGNWTSNPNFPNGIGDQATFSNTFPGVVAIDLGQDITVGSLNIDLSAATSTSFSIDNQQLTFQVPSGNPSLDVTNPTGLPLTISSVIEFKTNTDITVNGGASTALTLTGSLSGGFTKLGPGILLLEGTVPNAAGATVSEGIVNLNNNLSHALEGTVRINGGTLKSLAFGQIASGVHITVDSGTFDMGGFGQFAQTFTYNGGTVVQNGGNITVSNLPNAFTMRNTVINGEIVLTGGGFRFDATNNGTATLNGIIDLNGNTQTFNIEDGTADIDMIINSEIKNGSSIKTGSGTLLLNGTNTYAGSTTVNQGTLQIGGSIGGTTTDVNAGGILDVLALGTVGATTTTINNGGTLKGTGNTGNLVNSGMVRPGNSIGTLTVAGTYNQNADGDLEIEMNDQGQSDLLNVTGIATLDGTLTVAPELGIYPPGTRFRFMNYGSRLGALTLIDNTSLDFSISYDALFVELINNSAGSILPVPKRELHGNAFAVADYLFCVGFFPQNQDLLNVMRALVKTPANQFAEDLVKLSPIQFGALPLVNLQNHRLVGDVFVENTEKYFWCDPCNSNRKGKESCEQERKKTSIWITPIGSYYHQDGINRKPSQPWADKQIPFNAYSVGVGVGADHLFFNSLMFGGGAGYTYSHINWEKSRGDGHWNSIYMGPYLGWIKDQGYINLLLLGSYHMYHIDRNIRFPGIHRTAHNEHHSYDLLARLDGGYKFRVKTGGTLDHFYILPEGRISYLNIFENGYIESGAGSINLKVDSKYSAFLQPSVLVKFLRDFYRPGICMTPVLQIGWISNIPLASGNYTSRFYKQTTCRSHFDVKSFHKSSNQMTLGAEIIFRTDSEWIIEIGYKADIFDNQSVQNGKLKVEKRF